METPPLPPWLTISQAAEYYGVERTGMYTKMLRDLEVRRIGVRGGTSPLGLGGASFGGPNMGFAIPEPSSFLLLAVGAILFGMRTLRRHAS